jgi:hypothetical protein
MRMEKGGIVLISKINRRSSLTTRCTKLISVDGKGTAAAAHHAASDSPSLSSSTTPRSAQSYSWAVVSAAEACAKPNLQQR